MGTAAPLHPRPFRATGVGYQSPYTAHIYRPSHSHPLQRATTGRRAALTTSTIGPKTRSGGIWTCTAAGTQRHSNCQLASIESSQPSAPFPRVAELHAASGAMYSLHLAYSRSHRAKYRMA